MSVRSTRLRLLLLAALAVLCLAVWLLWPGPAAINLENFERIEVGMTLHDVEAILGGPAGNYGYHGSGIVQTHDAINVPRLAECRYVQWLDARHMIGVQFDADDRVVGKDLGEVAPAPL